MDLTFNNFLFFPLVVRTFAVCPSQQGSQEVVYALHSVRVTLSRTKWIELPEPLFSYRLVQDSAKTTPSDCKYVSNYLLCHNYLDGLDTLNGQRCHFPGNCRKSDNFKISGSQAILKLPVNLV